MRRLRRYVVVAGAVLMSALGAGCALGEGQCPRPIGAYRGTYTVLNGNCAEAMGRDIDFSKDDQLSTVKTNNTLSDSVTTEINLVGCTIGVSQSVSDASGVHMISSLNGDLNVEDEAALSGQLNYAEYMPDGTTQRCTSQVAASYTLQGTGALGAAAQHALATP
jgi:hypothetical protein